MIALPCMLLNPAAEAGIKVPDDPDNFNPEEFPHFQVFCNVQLGTALPSPNSHWKNAEVVAGIPEDKIRTITGKELLAAGLEV